MLLSNGDGYQIKLDEFKIPSVTYLTKKKYGSISVTVWPNPSDGQPKVCVQGTMYLAFISFVLPAVLKDIGASKAITNGNTGVEEANDLIGDEKADLAQLNGTLKRLENEVLNIGNNVSNKVDIALSNLTPAPEPTINNILKRVDNLEELLKSNQKQFASLANSVESLSSSITAQGAVSLSEINKDMLNDAVHSHPVYGHIVDMLESLRSEVAKAADLVQLKQNVAVNTEILKAVDTSTKATDTSIRDIGDKITSSIKASDNEISQLRKNSDESLKLFCSMKTSLENLVNTNIPSPAPTYPTPTEHHTPPATPVPPKRKGLMFSASIAKSSDMKRFSDTLNCDITVIPTDYIEKNPEADQPDAFLENMIKEHLVDKTGYSFVVLATGSTDITTLPTESGNVVTMYEQVKSHTGILCGIAQSITQEMNMDVFIVENPP